MERVCIVGAGVIGSLFAGHLAQVCDVSVLTRRREHADALNRDGLRISGKSDRHATVTATDDPDDRAAYTDAKADFVAAALAAARGESGSGRIASK